MLTLSLICAAAAVIYRAWAKNIGRENRVRDRRTMS